MAALRGPDLTNTIWYYVFDDDEHAADHFEYGALGRSATSSGQVDSGQTADGSPLAGAAPTTITEVYAPDFEQPAWCVAAKSGPWGWTSCTVLVGNVKSSATPRCSRHGAARGDDAHAIALAGAGVAHLLRLA